MLRISLAYIARFGELIDCLGKFPVRDTSMEEIGLQLIVAQRAVVQLHVPGSLYQPYLRASLASAGALIQAIQIAMGNPIDLKKSISANEIAGIKLAYDNYKPAILGELSSIDAYLVTRKGPYDSLSLLTAGELLFPDELLMKVPEAAFDAREAGKCLSFEVPTACGFHVFRVAEAVLRRYYVHVSGGKAPPKVRNFGVYLNAMKQAGVGDPKVLAILKQIIDLYRNPLIHPETVLTTDLALEILGLVRSAVTVMLATMPVLSPTTTTAAIATSQDRA